MKYLKLYENFIDDANNYSSKLKSLYKEVSDTEEQQSKFHQFCIEIPNAAGHHLFCHYHNMA